jgi:thiol:disulfide interchange protein
MVFVAVTALLLGLPALTVTLFGKRAASVLPRARNWMNANSWIVSECALGVFIVLTGKDVIG